MRINSSLNLESRKNDKMNKQCCCTSDIDDILGSRGKVQLFSRDVIQTCLLVVAEQKQQQKMTENVGINRLFVCPVFGL